ncbi:hydrolase [Rummeliibacillus sp. NPDC094406]|uniref:hydrolase n=1 Tax=Rummeliibacillus sp. NPDC094406 TaxID=3364511 RepID=UPI003820DBC2
MGSSRNHRNDCHKCHEKNRCRGCACDQLRRLQVQTEVDLYLKSGTVFDDVLFIFFDEKDCCAYFFDPENPHEAPSTIIVDCRDIQAIRIEGRDC